MGAMLLASNPQWGLAADGKGFCVFGFEIYFYAVFIVVGMVAAAALSALLMKRRNLSPDLIFLLFIVCIPSAIIGARLFSCITDPNLGIQRFFDFRDGGLSIIGGVVAGVTAGLVVCVVKKVNFLRAADCVVINILFAQALGRWGNFFNAEVYGGVVTDPSMQWFPLAVPIAPGMSGIDSFGAANVTWHYAFFFYEMLANLVGWALLFSAAWYWKKKPNGVFTCAYFVWYGIVRTIMEPLRDPSYILGHKVPASLVMSILFIVLGVACIGLLLFLNYRKEGALIGSKKGDPCGITEYLSPNKDEQPYFSKINMFGANYPPKPSKEELKRLKEEKKAQRAAEKQAEEAEHAEEDGQTVTAEIPERTEPHEEAKLQTEEPQAAAQPVAEAVQQTETKQESPKKTAKPKQAGGKTAPSGTAKPKSKQSAAKTGQTNQRNKPPKKD